MKGWRTGFSFFSSSYFCILFVVTSSNVALRPQKLIGFLGPGRPHRLAHSFLALKLWLALRPLFSFSFTLYLSTKVPKYKATTITLMKRTISSRKQLRNQWAWHVCLGQQSCKHCSHLRREKRAVSRGQLKKKKKKKTAIKLTFSRLRA